MADSNSYLIDNTDSDSEYNYILVDSGTGQSNSNLFSKIKEIGIEPDDIDLIVNTHCHYDHVGGNDFFPNAKIAIHRIDAIALRDPESELTVSSLFGAIVRRHDVDIELEEGDKIADFEVINTPGHTKGGVCYKIEDNLFTGDTLFKESVGRWDFPSGNYCLLSASIKKIFNKYNENLKCYPGHGDSGNLKEIKKYNEIVMEILK